MNQNQLAYLLKPFPVVNDLKFHKNFCDFVVIADYALAIWCL